MKTIIEYSSFSKRVNPRLCIVVLLSLLLAGSYTRVFGQKPVNPTLKSSLEMDSIVKQGPEYDILKPLAGNWKVVQTSYSMDAKVIMQDTFAVERKMIGNFLEETMQPVVKNETNSFTRTSYLNYNRTNLRWEYVVLDTRFPIMMFETSHDHQVKGDSISVYLDAFIMPPFLGKEYAGLLTKERRVITFKSHDIYIHRQYWTLPAGREFLAIEYVFKRQ